MFENDTKEKLDRWMRRQLFSSLEERGVCLKFTLRHVTNDKAGREVDDVAIKRKIKPEDIPSLISDVETLLHDDVESLGGVQTYAIFAHHEKGNPRSVTFRVRGGQADAEDIGGFGFNSEPPTNEGNNRALMRHLEATQRTFVAGIGTVMAAQARIINRLSEQNESLQSKHFDVIQTYAELVDDKHQRELDYKEQSVRLGQRQEIMNKLLLLLPMAVNRIGGKNLLPSKSTPLEQMLHSLFTTMNTEQVAAFTELVQTHFEPEKQAIVFEMMQAVRKFESNKDEHGSNGTSS